MVAPFKVKLGRPGRETDARLANSWPPYRWPNLCTARQLRVKCANKPNAGVPE